MRDDEQMQAGDQDALGVVRRYVAQLDAALAGCDPAVRNDAVIDAESHLRAAISGGVPAERAVAEFGTTVRAIDTVPRALLRPLRDSSGIGGRVGFCVMSGVKPPPWIMKPGITR